MGLREVFACLAKEKVLMTDPQIDLVTEARIVRKLSEVMRVERAMASYQAPPGYRQDFKTYYNLGGGRSATHALADLQWDISENWGKISLSLKEAIKMLFRVEERQGEDGIRISLL